jgi:hypothetical protein
MNRDLRTVVETAAEKVKVPETKIYEEKNEASFAVEPGPVENNLPVPAGVSYGSETPEHMEARGEGKIDDRAGEAAVTQTTAATPAEPENDVPVTMAATAEAVVAASTGASSWMAVSVALDSEEAAISLDHEMRKAYAAFAAAEADSAGVSDRARSTGGAGGEFFPAGRSDSRSSCCNDFESGT